MKQCPRCRNSYSNDNIFCLEDGTPLEETQDHADNPTVAFIPNEIPTQVLRPLSVQTRTPSVSGPSKWLYLLLGAMAATILALTIAFYYSRPESNENKPAKVAEEPARSSVRNSNENIAPQNSAKNVVSVSTPAVSTPLRDPNISPGGRWAGDWNSVARTTSTYFTAEMNLNDDGAGKINGQIIWTLRRTTNPKKIGKEGMSATEYVQGTFNPATRVLSLKGYRKEDPHGLVIIDKYNLALSADDQTLSGKSIGGQFILKR